MNWAWNKCFSADFIRKNNIAFQDISKTNDFYFVAKAMLLAERITTLSKTLVHYRKNTGVSTQDTNDLDPCAFLDAFRQVENFMKEMADAGIETDAVSPRLLPRYTHGNPLFDEPNAKFMK